jgi:DNA-binding NarL/FixJ family response regulator
MSFQQGAVESPTAGELVSVAGAAGARLQADGEGDQASAEAAAGSLREAAATAMAAGYSLTEIVNAEKRGQEEVRARLRGDFLRRVERTGRHARQTELEHHVAIARALSLGLSTREIAVAAGVTHGTIRAIANRRAGDSDLQEHDSDN